jgi:tetratricopeptide (TPR) repeat protein
VYYKDIPEAQTKLFRYCKTYRLLRLLWVRVLAKTREEGVFKQALALNPRNDRAYVTLGQSYRVQGKRSQAEDAFKQAIELNPRNSPAYAELGWLYLAQGKISLAEDLFKQAIKMNPRNGPAYAELGWLYLAQGKLPQAEDAFKQAAALNPQNAGAFIGLGQLYRNQGKLSQAEDAFKQAIKLNPRNDRVYGALSVLYEEMGKPELADAYAQKANELRAGYDNPVTRDNYRKLKAISDARGIRVVCVQYPMRSIEPLKKIFEGNEERVIFVDNEKVFKDAVQKDGYHIYFKDMFGGDFGHCTNKGNRLLADNIAGAILKEAFHK